MDVSTNNHNAALDGAKVDQVSAGQNDIKPTNPQQSNGPGGDEPAENVDAELEAMKKRLHQMEQETLGMHGTDETQPTEGNDEMGGANTQQQQQQQQVANPGGYAGVDEMTADSDARSIYVGNVDYNATGEELNQHFHECGTINRVTIMCHKATGQPKGYAYIEFKERESVQHALILNESMFRGRQLKVVEKRTNIPGVTRGGRGRGRYQRGYRGGYRGRPRGRGRPRARYAPY